MKATTIRKSHFKGINTSIRSTASLPKDIDALIPDEIVRERAPGEADVAISGLEADSIAISGDSDLLYSSGPNIVAIPVRRGNSYSFVVCNCILKLIVSFCRFMIKI